MHVLLVEDDAVLADGLIRSLQGHGMQVELARDGLQADLMLQRSSPSVTVLDIGLPGIDGYEVARRLRALETGRSFLIVAVTGWDQEADKRRSEEAGFDMHLVKPVAPADLEKALTHRNGATLH